MIIALYSTSVLCGVYPPPVYCVVPIFHQCIMWFLSSTNLFCGVYPPPMYCVVHILQQFIVCCSILQKCIM